ncbi:MAG: type I 3-dehydroquinate dehydratase, partial [Acidobacteriota bacterium]
MSRPLLAVTITAPTMAELRRRRDEASEADLVELRLDTVADPDVAGALAGRQRPVIVTCRPTWEGGAFRGAEEERRRILGDALTLGAEYVDVEARAGFDDLVTADRGRRIVLSRHDFEGVPADLADLVRAMRATGAEVVKIAVTAHRLSDCLPLLELAAVVGGDQGVVAIAMGPFGAASRILAGRFGSRWTYAGGEQQIGQIALAELVNQYRFRHVTDSTGIYGLAGYPVSHSVSPAMHNAAFAAAGIDAVYVPLPSADAEDVVTFGRALGIKGLSITIPHKVSLLAHLDEVLPTAQSAGAVNTIRVQDGRWTGANTDIAGLLAPLAGRSDLTGLRAAVLGSGGAARAAAVGLA